MSLSNDNPSKIMDLLIHRERVGVINTGRSPFRKGSHVPPTDALSSAVAWNPSRLQNMILAVGPGTPASTVMITESSTSSSSSSQSSQLLSSNAEESDDDDDDDVGPLTAARQHRSESDDDTGPLSAERHGRSKLRGRRRWIKIPSDEEKEEEEEEEEEEDEKEEERSGDAQMSVDREDDEEEEKSASVAAGTATRGDDMQHDSEQATTSASTRRSRRRSSSSTTGSGMESRSTTATTRSALLRQVRHVGGIMGVISGGRVVGTEWSIAMDSDSHDDEDDENGPEHLHRRMRQSQMTQTNRRNVKAPSMRHGGCINTAAWMTCPWRLSLASCNYESSSIFSSSFSSNDNQSGNGGGDSGGDGGSGGVRMNDPVAMPVSSTECPTQLITSGDDRVVKFWDVSGAMGSCSPLPGGMSTVCPFSAPIVSGAQPVKEWKKRSKRGDTLPGMVAPLATIQTGHRGNVFHATPVPTRPGKVATCAADGFLRLADVEHQAGSSHSSNSSTIIISPEFDDDASSNLPGLLSLRPGMCFSHHFLDANTGLLCSERGLRRFDLRLSPREQMSRSILGGPYRTCKACAIWYASASGVVCSADSLNEDLDSAYVFAGGSSADVALYDLRMTDGTTSRIVQHYRPRDLGPGATVSVSGLDISRDKRELLVSYENDQIYTFPIFPSASSAAGPTLEELSGSSSAEDDDAGQTTLLSELASYGGHLNRYTFLKNAKYAGPNDEYICTGSDSGHAWIYERSTGAVVSLLNADHSTCNGVVPHPSLPFFITYGIDSTAKLWRATTPVDNKVDDSHMGRIKTFHESPYERSALVRSWKSIQGKISSMGDFDDDSLSIFPDEVPAREDDFEDSIFGSLGGVFFRSGRMAVHAPGGPYIGNDLRNLPQVLAQNYFACVRAHVNGDDEPVRSGLDGLKRRTSLIRLRHQADQLGLTWNCSLPWIMKPKTKSLNGVSSLESVHDADLVPNYPGDWIPYDMEMSTHPKPCGMQFNDEEYGDFVRERYGNAHKICSAHKNLSEDVEQNGVLICGKLKNGKKSVEEHETEGRKEGRQSYHGEDESSLIVDDIDIKEDDLKHNAKRAWDVLYETILLLKDGGNAALQAGAIPLAARRYDKAIQYCAVVYMKYPSGNADFMGEHQNAISVNGGHEVRWTPLLKLLVSVRLNLSMTLLKAPIKDFSAAADQAQLALHELKPFVFAKGNVMTGRKLDADRDDEPHETFQEAKELQAKAYFRLGTAQHSSGDFASAVRSFEHSVKCTKESSPGKEPEQTVLRRLAEAKRENARKKKRHRKKFKFMFSGEDEQKETNESEGEGKDDSSE